jgi:hypothetical protein
VGVTSMLIASKYEEIYSPEIKDFIYITDNAYTKEDILNMEYEILSKLSFSLTAPTQFRFLERFADISSAHASVFSLAQYLLEISLIEYQMLYYTPAILAVTSLVLSI